MATRRDTSDGMAQAGLIAAILTGVISLLSSGVLGAYRLLFETRNLILQSGSGALPIEVRRHVFESDWWWLWIGYSIGMGMFGLVFLILAYAFWPRGRRRRSAVQRRVWCCLTLLCILAAVSFVAASVANFVIGYSECIFLKSALKI